MPETYGQPEPELTSSEQAQRVVNEVVAGQGVVRKVVLYCVIVSGLALGPALWPVAFVGLIAVVLLMATDGGLV